LIARRSRAQRVAAVGSIGPQQAQLRKDAILSDEGFRLLLRTQGNSSDESSAKAKLEPDSVAPEIDSYPGPWLFN
jgi:hypothetical protein